MSALPTGARVRQWWTAMGYGFVALVIYLTLTRSPPDLGPVLNLDYGHIVAYCWLMLWFAQVETSLPRRLKIASAFFVMGVTLEYLQGAMGYRHFDYFDMLRNLAGLVIGFLLALTPLQRSLVAFEGWVRSR